MLVPEMRRMKLEVSTLLSLHYFLYPSVLNDASRSRIQKIVYNRPPSCFLDAW